MRYIKVVEEIIKFFIDHLGVNGSFAILFLIMFAFFFFINGGISLIVAKYKNSSKKEKKRLIVDSLIILISITPPIYIFYRIMLSGIFDYPMIKFIQVWLNNIGSKEWGVEINVVGVAIGGSIVIFGLGMASYLAEKKKKDKSIEIAIKSKNGGNMQS